MTKVNMLPIADQSEIKSALATMDAGTRARVEALIDRAIGAWLDGATAEHRDDAIFDAIAYA